MVYKLTPTELEDYVIEFSLKELDDASTPKDVYRFIVSELRKKLKTQDLVLEYTDGDAKRQIKNERDFEDLAYTDAAWILDYFEFMNKTVSEVLDWEIEKEPIF